MVSAILTRGSRYCETSLYCRALEDYFFKNESNKLSRLLSMYLLCTVIREGFAHNRWLAAIQQHYIAKAESNDFASAM